MTLALTICIMQALMFAAYIKFGSNVQALKRQHRQDQFCIKNQAEEIRRLRSEDYSARFRGTVTRGRDF